MKINNKAFTLIELLAVIVILAIIALIATPIVLNIIKDSKESSQLRSGEMYLDAVEQAVMREKMTNTSFKPNTCTVLEDGNLECDGDKENIVTVEVEGEVPDSGTIIFNEGKIDEVRLIYGTKIIAKDENNNLVYTAACTLAIDTDNSKTITRGDEIECAKEEFYVIDNDGSTISMLAKYNLNVGSNTYSEGIVGIQNENVVGWKSGITTYGTIVFSTSGYWYSSGLKEEYGTSYPAWVYDSNADVIYPYVEAYETYLKGKGVTSADATLISFEQLEKLECSGLYKTCTSAPSWVYSTSYWSGSARDDSIVWSVRSSGLFNCDDYSRGSAIGLRPVVNISVNEI